MPAQFDPSSLPLLASVSVPTRSEKLQEGWETILDPESPSTSLIVQGHLGVSGELISQAAVGLGATYVEDNPGLPENFVVVTAPGAAFMTMLDDPRIAQVLPMPNDHEPGRPIHMCLGPWTSYGLAAWDYNTQGWDGPGRGCATIGYHFRNGTNDIPGDLEQEAIRDAMREWSRHADLFFQETHQKKQPRTIDFKFVPEIFLPDVPLGELYGIAEWDDSIEDEPKAGDIRFNNSQDLRIDGVLPEVDMYSLALHELGHALGLGHDLNPGAVMHSEFKRYDELTTGDISRIRQVYSFNEDSGWAAYPLDWAVTDVTDEFALSREGSQVFYNTSDGRLRQFSWDSGGWSNGVVRWDVNNVAGDLDTAWDGSNVFYRGTDHGLWNFYWDGVEWQNAPIDPNTKNVAGDVKAAPSGGQVYYRATDGSVWNAYWTGGSWASAPLRTDVSNVAGDVGVTSLGSNVYYSDGLGRVWNYYWLSGGWSHDILRWDVANAAGGLVTSQFGSNVFYRGMDHRLWNYYWAGSGWQHSVVNWNAKNLTEDLASSTIEPRVFFRTQDNRMSSALSTSGSSYNVKRLNHAVDNVAGPVAVRDLQVFYRGTDNRMWNFVVEPCRRGVE